MSVVTSAGVTLVAQIACWKNPRARLSMPLLVCLADRDLQASSTFAARVATRAPYADVRHYLFGHFDVYLDGRGDQRCTARFLRAHLPSATPHLASVAAGGT